ncbi:MAG: tetratricopeptide repeat protein, partial [Deltaproteobacteria bacterium]|nr:tetratricopeptide repeat protein [Deltaproteobacteria bacterium]
MSRSRRLASLCAVLALAMGGSLLGACQSQETKISEHQERGEQYAKDGKYAEAVIEFKNVLQLDPNQAKAHYGLAKA